MRKFINKPARRSAVPLLVGLCGPSGSGKTYSALRLAKGMNQESGGKTFLIDTESGRSLHYSDDFEFEHVPFEEPFASLDYMAAIKHCQAQGAKTVIIDSMSHEHNGVGGLLDYHNQEVERMAGGPDAPSWKRDALNFPAWAKPKADHSKLINCMLQTEVNMILCFRAKNKIKMLSKAAKAKAKANGERAESITQLGLMPISGDDMIFEMMMNCLLTPNCDGVPTWEPEEVGERSIVKIPKQFRHLADGRSLSEDFGREMAEWASGGGTDAVAEALANIREAQTESALNLVKAKLNESKWTKGQKLQIKAALDEKAF